MRWLLLIALGAATTAPAAPLSVSLKPCVNGPALCGSLTRPLDPSGQAPGSIAIRFELFPARDAFQPAIGTIAAGEGGRGYASRGSAGGCLGLFEPLLDRRNLL